MSMSVNLQDVQTASTSLWDSGKWAVITVSDESGNDVKLFLTASTGFGKDVSGLDAARALRDAAQEVVAFFAPEPPPASEEPGDYWMHHDYVQDYVV